MIQNHKHLLAVLVLLLLAGFTLAACSDTGSVQPPIGGDSLAVPQGNTTKAFSSQKQNINTDWDAASFFAASCASCHGPTGNGTAMPAWSIESGGPLNSDQIADMAAFLQAGYWDKAGEIASDQPVSPVGTGMMGGGMMRSGMMGRGFETDR